MNKNKKTPKFKNEDEEREFWVKADSSEYIDWINTKKAVLPKLQASAKITE